MQYNHLLLQMPGNDIVDLEHSDSLRITENQRFLQRVFSETELLLIQDSNVRIWEYWALKESAFKALRSLDPHIPFAWKEFTVRPDEFSAAERFRAAEIILCSDDEAAWKDCHRDYYTVEYRDHLCFAFAFRPPGFQRRAHAVAVSSQTELQRKQLLISESVSADENHESAKAREKLSYCIKKNLFMKTVSYSKNEAGAPVITLEKGGLQCRTGISLSHHGIWNSGLILV